MTSQVNPIPAGYPGVTPYLTVRDAAAAIDFYCQAFGATETMRVAMGGKIGHAELQVGQAPLMLSDEFPEMGALGPQPDAPSPLCLHLYVADVDAVVARAVAAGATLLNEVADMFYGDRAGKLRDPFGHVWWLSSHIEDVPPDEIQRRAAAMFGG